MASSRNANPTRRLVVFSDDWGRHPSSCQHLVGRMLAHDAGLRALWVNTSGTRKPRLTWADAKRGVAKLRGGRGRGDETRTMPGGLSVVAPRMYPGFRSGWQRRLNAGLLRRAVEQGLGNIATEDPNDRPVTTLLTTLPIAADLVEPLRRRGVVDRVVYDCVDDFSVWPGGDGPAMDAMERDLVPRADCCLCASEVLRSRVAGLLGEHGRTDAASIGLLTHGVDLEHWGRPTDHPSHEPGRYVFWGLVDCRLDPAWCDAIRDGLTLVGPTDDPPADLPGQRMGPRPWSALPAVAAEADVLVMPYADLPVTRAMQPLKLLEYLAAGWPDRFRPVVVRDLPATRAWAGCCDVVRTADEFARVCRERVATGCPPEQAEARRRRLPGESWDDKARRLAAACFPKGSPDTA